MTKRIEAYTFYDFIMKVQEAVQDGWLIDPDDPEGYPQAHVGFYRCSVHKQNKIAALLLPKVPDVVESVKNEYTTEESQIVQPAFVPSVFFTVEQDQPLAKRTAGRPKASTI